VRARDVMVMTAMAGAAGAAGVAAVRYRQDMAAARTRLAAVDRRVVSTGFGAVEHAERGAGDPLVVSHAIFHGCDGGLASVRDIVDGRRAGEPRLGRVSGW
jgi:hypothetical protein